jgi:hypothetical protein
VADEMNEILVPICLFNDGTVLSLSGSLSLEPVLFSLMIHNRETQKSHDAWLPLGYINDPSNLVLGGRNDEFIRNYPISIFRHYNRYMKGNEDGIMWWGLRTGPPPTVSKTKDKMIEAIAREKMRLIRIPVDQPNEYWREQWDILNECLVMIKEYHNPPGYRMVKRRWDEGSFCNQGTLKKGNESLGYIIGEVVDFVSPSVEVERIVEKHIKAIAVVETWKTKERFIEAWETGVFGGKTSERALVRYIYLGWRLTENIGLDSPVLTHANERDSRLLQNSVQFDRCKLGNFRDKAWNMAYCRLP